MFWASSHIWSFSADIWLNLKAALRQTFSKFVRHVWRDRRIARSLMLSISYYMYMPVSLESHTCLFSRRNKNTIEKWLMSKCKRKWPLEPFEKWSNLRVIFYKKYKGKPILAQKSQKVFSRGVLLWVGQVTWNTNIIFLRQSMKLKPKPRCFPAIINTHFHPGIHVICWNSFKIYRQTWFENEKCWVF